MNAIEIEEAVSDLAAAPFDAAEFPFRFLQAFGNKEVAIKRLRAASNSDIPGAVLQKSNIHLAISAAGQVSETLAALRESPKTSRNKCKFILATDGDLLEVEDTNTGEHIACKLPELPDYFGFLLPLAGISTVAQIKNNPIDIRATRHLNKLYIALLSENPDWATPERRHDLNQFMARLIFCFFAEDTGIFFGENLFTRTLTQFSEPDSSNTHDVISELFRAMDLPIDRRTKGDVKNWANAFPYVNGGLFAGTRDVPKFSRMARATLLAAGSLKWTHINPDIFGSMIQAVADEDERGALGMHYTSVPNIMKVLGPLFLDELTAALEEAGDNGRKLLNLRRRLARIRVFDPACGSGNFLVIAYIRMREIEQEIIRRRKDDPKSVIKLTQFYGIEIKSFPAEIARLALLIAEFQCNVRMIGQQEAILDILPLHQTGNIHCGNALRMDWLEVCPAPKVSLVEEDLAAPTGKLALEGAAGDAWDTYLCGNPPYQGSVNQTTDQKEDMALIFGSHLKTYKDLDYVSGWFVKAAEYLRKVPSASSLVSTNSLCQGEQVGMLWPIIFSKGIEIHFCHLSFRWTNNAANNAGVSCIVVGLSPRPSIKKMFEDDVVRVVDNISPYLTATETVIVQKRSKPLSEIALMQSGNKATDAGALLLEGDEKQKLVDISPEAKRFLRKYIGSRELINGGDRWCLWVPDDLLEDAAAIPELAKRFQTVAEFRSASRGKQANDHAHRPHRFVFSPHTDTPAIVISNVSSETRHYLPVSFCSGDTVASNLASVIYDAPLWNMALIASRLHLVWIATVCGKLETRYRYSNTLGWNTFPVPKLTESNKADLTRCAEDILLAREAHFPATIADLYEPDKMPENLRAAHERNDTVLEEIYIGRRFRNDTERLEKLFDMYTKMTKKGAA